MHTKIALVSTRKNSGIQQLKSLIENYKTLPTHQCLDASTIDPVYFERLQKAFPNQELYKLWVVITQDVNFGKITRQELDVSKFKTKSSLELKDSNKKKPLNVINLLIMFLKKGKILTVQKHVI